VHVARGHAFKTIGRVEEAIGAYRNGYTVRPGHGDAFWSLANLKTYRFTDEELDLMQRHEAEPNTDIENKAALCFALGKAFEDSEVYDESFAYYKRGNDLKHQQYKYQKERLEAEFRYQKDHFDKHFFDMRKSYGHDAPDPIFIVGLPRAGSTLLEQILASHSQVDGTMELASIISMAHRFNARQGRDEEPRYPKVLGELSESNCSKLGEQ
jgi:tetratricopeptide (TPR) repeat protein